MTHVDPEVLALLALDPSDAPTDVVSHVATCSTCRAELAQLQQVVEHTRDATGVGTGLSRPRPAVWAAIRDALDSPGSRDDELTAHATLVETPPALFSASGEAEVGTDDRGRRVLQVTLHADLPDHGLRQAWLIRRDDPDRRQTIGILDGTSGVWSIDRAIDLRQYAIVEITQQDVGSTRHSGRVVARGDLVVAA